MIAQPTAPTSHREDAFRRAAPRLDIRTGENLLGSDRLRIYPVDVRGGLPDDVAELVVAAANRFVHSPLRLKHKHVMRTVYQARRFVSLDGWSHPRYLSIGNRRS